VKSTRIYMSAIAACLMASGIAHAAGVERPQGSQQDKAVYEGVDDKGNVVRLTICDERVKTFVRIRPSRQASHAKPHWSSLFGTGQGAEAELNP
jgi:hypothetical protein